MSELKKGSRLTLRVDRLSLGGDAVGRLPAVMQEPEGIVVFVPYGAPGDTLEVELTEVRQRFARARVIRVVEASPVRQKPPCPYHFQAQKGDGRREMGDTAGFSPLTPHPSPLDLFCGGCSWQHMTYEFQLDAKQQLVQETLERIGKVQGVDVKPVLGMKDPWRYRNKVQQPVGWDGQRIISGFYAPFSHDIVPIEDCLVQSELSVRILNRARALLEQFGLRVYDENRHTGWIRHLWVRTTRDNRAILVFITRTPDFSHLREIVVALGREFPELVGIHQNVNPGKTNVILGREWRCCAGGDYLEERLGKLKFHLSPGSFFQVNSLQTEVLYDQVRKMAGQGDTLLDLYCGVGGIALWLAPQFRQVIGVDEVKSAVVDAQKNASLNQIRNTRFITSASERFIAGFREPGAKTTVILDPPRAGCAPQVLQALIRLRPAILIYVSCDPGTLARDIALLGEGGYRPQDVQPVDLFPHTPHIETVVRLDCLN